MAINTNYARYFGGYPSRVKPLAEYHNQKIEARARLNFGLYCELLAHRSHSGSKAQTQYINWLERWINHHIPTAVTTKDKAGNLYAVKGTSALYPCFVSHCDINQSKNDNVAPVKAHNWITGIDTQTGERAGLGHDDKAGNLLALLALQTLPHVKCLFTTDEETGGRGAARANLKFFKDCTLVIQADRNAYAGPELITYSGGTEMASKEFVAAAMPTMDRYNFKESRGVFTDVNVLKDEGLKICAVNITAGYFDEHRDNEALYIPAFENSAAFALELCQSIGHEVWPHMPPPRPVVDWSKYPVPSETTWTHADWYSDTSKPRKSWRDYLPAETKKNWYATAADNCPDCGAHIEQPEVINGFICCPHCLSWYEPK